MPEQCHQGLQAAARVHEGCRIGVPQLMGHNIFQPCLRSGTVKLVPERAGRDAPALVGEEELDQLGGAGVA